MVKKIFLSALCALVTVSFVGCNEDVSEDTSSMDGAIESSNSSTLISSDEILSDEEESDNSAVASLAEENYVSINGTNLFIPEGFIDENSYGNNIYSKTFGNDIIYFSYHGNCWYSCDTDQESYELENVPDIESEEFPNIVYEVIPCYINKLEATVNSETNETIGDKLFIKQKGIMHTEYEETEDTHELQFIELYTLNDNKFYTKVPTSIILFSDCYDEETEAELERLAEEIVTKTEWSIEY